MKLFIVLALCVATAVAKPYGYDHSKPSMDSYTETKPSTTPVPIIEHEFNDDNKGNYNLKVKTGDGTIQTEQGRLKDLGNKEGPIVVKEGSYSWTSPEGKSFTVLWKSDEFGTHVTGDHLPTSPPIPDEIAKALKTLPREYEKVSSYARDEAHSHSYSKY